MSKRKSPRKKGMTRKERDEYNHWLWNLEARDFNAMSQQELAKIAGQYQRQFAKRAKELDKLQAETGISSDALRVARNAFENTRFLTGPQFLPSSHIVRNGKIRYSVPQLRSIVSNYAHFFRESPANSTTIRTNTVQGTLENYNRMVERLDKANEKVSQSLGVPIEELTPADYQAMWKAYDLFKEIYTEAFGILQSVKTQEAMYQAYQEAPSGSSTMELVERMFEKAFDRVATNGDLSKKYRSNDIPEDYYWGDKLEQHLKSKGFNIIKWNNNV